MSFVGNFKNRMPVYYEILSRKRYKITILSINFRYIFALNCFESGVMSETEWNIYQDWSTYLIHALGDLKLDGIIYLRSEPEVNKINSFIILAVLHQSV